MVVMSNQKHIENDKDKDIELVLKYPVWMLQTHVPVPVQSRSNPCLACQASIGMPSVWCTKAESPGELSAVAISGRAVPGLRHVPVNPSKTLIWKR